MSILNIFSTTTLFSDKQISSNPQAVDFDWIRPHQLITVSNGKKETFSVNPGATLSVFNGVLSTSIDGTTTFSSTLNSILQNTYRFTWTGGTNPVLKINRNLTLTGLAVTVSTNNNVLATFSVPSGGATFSGVVVGDLLFLPGPTTGDGASPFNVLNQGFWSVLAVASNNLSVTVVRLPGQLFQAANETQTLTSNGQLIAFANAGIQIGNKVQISAGFSSVDFGVYTISSITPNFFEITSTTLLPLETGVLPTSSGLTFYSVAKRFLRVETDQPATLILNGSNNIPVVPFVVANFNGMSFLDLWGNTYSLSVTNGNPGATMSLVVISAE